MIPWLLIGFALSSFFWGVFVGWLARRDHDEIDHKLYGSFDCRWNPNINYEARERR